MRVHKDGYIQARGFEIRLPREVIHRARMVGHTLGLGLEREIYDFLGVSIEGAARFRVVADDIVSVESDWIQPTRS